MTGIRTPTPTRCCPTKAILAIAVESCARCCSSPSIWTKSWRLPIVGVVLLLVVCGRRRRHLSRRWSRPARSSPVREVARGAVHPEQHQRHPRRVRARPTSTPSSTTRATTATQGQLRNDADDRAGHPHPRPERRLPHLPAAAGRQELLPVPRHPRRRPLHRRRARRATPLSRSASSTLTVCPPGSATGSTTTRSTRTATASSRPTATARTRTASRSSSSRASPPTGSLGEFQPRIYFGEQSPDYSIVGAAAGASPREFDYPDSSPAGQANTRTPAGRRRRSATSRSRWPTPSSTAS